ncbi:pentapeptide repeat-containing protein [Nostoc spongiaeforme FACHB-130]|uniref:Pentapeptide repeat-containing protein n=1 Tax=Nostoc spongiaeforme FACHB-130 TaxID=1357510 RepID=A0ABR8G5C2_9NOSO|nr:pentapeptide repeat-containing protein [Nostoc spongiaeforme]MBD2598372.1 pentapeptide repeat-containing protein [Nostoc spongiaeforme FACHB-130]
MALDFSGQNLRGRNFKGQNLVGANFSYADIRGANFSGANLTGANFSHAKAGLQRRWVIGLVLVSLLLSGLSGYLWSFNGYVVSLIFSSSNENQIAGFIALIILIAFSFITIRQGIIAGLKAGAFAIVGTFAGGFALTVAEAFSVAGSVAVVVAGAFTGAFALTVAGVLAGNKAIVVAVVVAGVFARAGVVVVAGADDVAGAIAVTGALFSTYISWQAIKGDQKYSLLLNLTIALAAIGGTSFRHANLTNADFTQARLKSTDFRNTILTRTCYYQARMLDYVRPGSTYLQNPQIRQLLVTGEAQGQNFDRQNLRGIKLQKDQIKDTSKLINADLGDASFIGADLGDASFIGADLSNANLQNANLSRAKLKQTQLDATDLTGATLTGAFIEDWGITRETKLHGVRCEYVFMRLPTKENPDPLRKPDNQQEVFQDGDFAEFIQPIFDTLDLYHNQGVDPRAIAIAFKKLAENHPEAELEIVAMEKRGDDKLLLRAKTAEGINKSQLSAEYFDEYNWFKALPPDKQLLLFAEKNSKIQSLENIVNTLLNRPNNYYQIEGDYINMSQNNPINISAGRDISGVINLGQIGGDVTNTIQHLSASPQAAQPGIKELLTQLQEAISQSSDLSDENKAEALEQVKTLAEAGQNPQEPAKQKTAKTAITMLKGLFSGLPAVATLVEAANKLLPVISKVFGLG